MKYLKVIMFGAMSLAYGVLYGNACNTANLITSEEDFESGALSGDLAFAGASPFAQCAGPGNNNDLWYRFVTEASIHGIRATGDGDADLAIEVYTGCGFGLFLLCENSTGPGETEEVILNGLTPGETYYYRIYEVSEMIPVNTTFTTSVAHVPFVQLRSSDCGNLEFNTNQLIRSTAPSNNENLTNYQWRFTELEAPFNTYTITSPNGANPNFLLKWFPQAEYGRNYSVAVRIRGLFPAWGDFSEECTIGFQDQVLRTALEPQYSGGIFNFCDIVGATPVSLSTQYRWTFLNLNNSLQTQVLGLADSRLLNMSRVPQLELGTTYVVGVFATVAGQESPPGTLRFLFTNNAVPNTGLNTNLYPCGGTYPISSFFQANEVCNAESYTWRFSNTSTVQPDIIYTRTDGSRFVALPQVPGLIVGDSYDVDVFAAQGGLVGDYSTVCNITIGASEAPGILPFDGLPNPDDGLSPISKNEGWEMSVYPVTNDKSTYRLTVFNSDPGEDINCHVVDLNGRVIAQKRTYLNFGEGLNWNLDALAPGVYLIRVIKGNEAKSKKIIIF